MIRHKVTLHKRHHGVHTVVRVALVEHTSSFIIKTLYCEIPSENEEGEIEMTRRIDDYKVRERLLADTLNLMGVLPVPANQVLLVVNNIGSYGAEVFKPWAKYFDCYSLFLDAGKRLPGHVLGMNP